MNLRTDFKFISMKFSDCVLITSPFVLLAEYYSKYIYYDHYQYID